KEHDFLFSASTGAPWDMNVFRRRKMRMLLKSLGIRQAGFHAFRHFNVALLDSLCVPLKVIQERAGHALTGSFTLDVYGGKPEWVGNVEAARKAGIAIEQSVAKAQETEPFVGLTAVKVERLWVPEILDGEFRKLRHVLLQLAKSPLSSGAACAPRAHRGG